MKFKGTPADKFIANQQQQLMFWEDQTRSKLAKADEDPRMGRRGRYLYHDCIARLYLVCWDLLATGKHLATLEEPAAIAKQERKEGSLTPLEEVLQQILMAEIELALVPQLLEMLVDRLLDGEEPPPEREEGWPFCREKAEEAAAPPAKPEGPG